MSDLRERLRVAQSFAQAAKVAPIWAKERAVEQMVAAMLALMAEMIDVIEGERDGEGKNR